MSMFLRSAAILGLICPLAWNICLAKDEIKQGSETTSEALPAQARATRASEVHSVFLVAEECRTAIANALEDEHIRLGAPGDTVDVILNLKLTLVSGWLTEAPLIGRWLGGFATRAVYEAKLIGRDSHVLLSLHGEERAFTGREMCQDIGDNIADRLTRRRNED